MGENFEIKVSDMVSICGHQSNPVEYKLQAKCQMIFGQNGILP